MALGLTRYGVSNTTIDTNSKSTKRTYNGINFADDTTTTKLQQVNAFFKGSFLDESGGTPSIVNFPGSFSAIVTALGLTQGTQTIVQENPVT